MPASTGQDGAPLHGGRSNPGRAGPVKSATFFRIEISGTPEGRETLDPEVDTSELFTSGAGISY